MMSCGKTPTNARRPELQRPRWRSTSRAPPNPGTSQDPALAACGVPRPRGLLTCPSCALPGAAGLTAILGNVADEVWGWLTGGQAFDAEGRLRGRAALLKVRQRVMGGRVRLRHTAGSAGARGLPCQHSLMAEVGGGAASGAQEPTLRTEGPAGEEALREASPCQTSRQTEGILVSMDFNAFCL